MNHFILENVSKMGDFHFDRFFVPSQWQKRPFSSKKKEFHLSFLRKIVRSDQGLRDRMIQNRQNEERSKDQNP